ncbi:MAG: hypothetical protein M0033_10225 [Nitrospiraceae bacterium]|nr:hypothetical protein [Nitrospiraceae bacterium]
MGWVAFALFGILIAIIYFGVKISKILDELVESLTTHEHGLNRHSDDSSIGIANELFELRSFIQSLKKNEWNAYIKEMTASRKKT